jgi:nucleotide-binding universal stress UspA family protein
MDKTKMQLIGGLKNILLATDGSEYSGGAINEAIFMAKSCESRLSVIYVLDINPELETEGLQIVERMEIAAKEHLDALRNRIAKENIECETIVRRSDNPYKAIIEEAKKRNSDVIVMGRRGKTGLKKVLMGSVTAKVIGYAPCKVLVVPKDAVIKCEYIMLATDGSKNSEPAEQEAVNLSKRCPQLNKFTVLSVARTDDRLEQAKATVEKVRKAAEHEGVNVEAFALVGRPYEIIIETAKDKNIDLIIVGGYGRTGITKLFMGSVAERVIGLSRCAVLIVK